jgi:methylmalonyl-CoA/ethylmalonyl-CoA epimerase
MPPDRLVHTLDHVAIGVGRVADVPAFLVGELGGRPWGAGPGAGFRWWQFAFARNAIVEILEPAGPPGGFLHRFLERHGPGVHHVTFKVPDLAAVADHVRSRGYDVVGYDDRDPSWKEAFLHPKQAQGIVVQLAESHPGPEPEGGAAAGGGFPALPAPRPDPVDVVGLRLNAHSLERARHQWASTLGGACRERGGGLELSWADSPLRIRVDVDPGAPEGPVAVEVASDANVALPDGPHPVLGVAFRRAG